MRTALRLLLIAGFALPFAACVSYHEEPRKPAPVVVNPPANGPVVVTPNR
jgi:hypothetical protein